MNANGRCELPILRGKNKGLLCGDVNKRCHHNVTVCPICQTKFTRDTSYLKHMKSCGAMPGSAPPASTPAPVSTLTSTVSTTSAPVVRQTTLAPLSAAALAEAKSMKRVSRDFYKELQKKMGKAETLRYLVKIALEKNPTDIIQSLYFEGAAIPPIACLGRDFRYVNSGGDIVDDLDGAQLLALTRVGSQNALILACNDIIAEQIQNSDGPDIEDIRIIQNYIIDISTCKLILPKLIKLSLNPQHVFFQ